MVNKANKFNVIMCMVYGLYVFQIFKLFFAISYLYTNNLTLQNEPIRLDNNLGMSYSAVKYNGLCIGAYSTVVPPMLWNTVTTPSL